MERLISSYQLLITAACTNTGSKMKGSHSRAADWCPLVLRHSLSQVTSFMQLRMLWNIVVKRQISASIVLRGWVVIEWPCLFALTVPQGTSKGSEWLTEKTPAQDVSGFIINSCINYIYVLNPHECLYTFCLSRLNTTFGNTIKFSIGA